MTLKMWILLVAARISPWHGVPFGAKVWSWQDGKLTDVGVRNCLTPGPTADVLCSARRQPGRKE